MLTEESVRPICTQCHKREAKKKGKSVNGFQIFGKLCNTCHEKKYRPRFIYRNYKKTFCERCGFIAEDRVQLDVHHIDGNHKNDDVSNLQTLCANCHRLVTKLGDM